ncbi:unnamed protein product [Cuscuta campestris]|uniref:RBR-type E3 ubiquitin transferase n=1 Tax=Cuscuta campestris TaxID=132261 RepID=A0A484NMD7_9ASTE|nr:unnamed protein product [Cuscuta campestris]
MSSSRTKPSSSSQRKQQARNWIAKPLLHDPTRNPQSEGDSGASSSAASQCNPNLSEEVRPEDPSGQKLSRNSRRKSRNRHSRDVKAPPDCLSGSENRGESRSDGGGGGVDCAEEDSERNSKENDGGNGLGTEKGDNGDDDDIGRRLEELRLGVEEPVLSEEQLGINDQAQEDELLALDSIYGDNVFHLDRHNGLRSFQIHIHIDVPKELTVSVNIKTSAMSTRNDDLPEFLYSFKIVHLPPITLSCLLPKSYPSHLPPHFTMSVQWLKTSEISQLCHVLDSIWHEQSGQEVIYQWVEWLQSSSLSHLQFDHEIKLGPYEEERHVGDRRAISGSVSLDFDIPFLKSYDDEQRYENFSKNIQECCICIGESPGSEFVRLPCQHFFCFKCMRTFANMHVKEGTLSKLQCPSGAKCGGMIPPGLLKRLLDEEGFEQWENSMLQKTLESMSDVCYCPRCETICIEDEENHAQCPKCFYSFCTLCRDKRHVGVACMSPEIKLAILQERQHSSQLKGDQKQREREMINEILSLREINRSAKQCPSCKMAISRSEGCNKMECKNCGQYFCYRCNKAIDGYDHFRVEQCELFPMEAIQMWEERMNARQAVGQIRAQQLNAAHGGHPCPICRQLNAKVGNNNHIFCWACQNHYCYLCRKTVKRSSHHFGPKGCKQHTFD